MYIFDSFWNLISEGVNGIVYEFCCCFDVFSVNFEGIVDKSCNEIGLCVNVYVDDKVN